MNWHLLGLWSILSMNEMIVFIIPLPSFYFVPYPFNRYSVHWSKAEKFR